MAATSVIVDVGPVAVHPQDARRVDLLWSAGAGAGAIVPTWSSSASSSLLLPLLTSRQREREREREREGWGDLVSPWTWTCFLQEVQVSHSAWNELGCGIEATRENNRFTELGLGDEVLRVFTRFSCFPYVLFSRFLAITRPLPGFTGLCCMRLRSDGCVGKREFAVQCVRLSFRAEQRTMGVCQNNRNGDAK